MCEVSELPNSVRRNKEERPGSPAVVTRRLQVAVHSSPAAGGAIIVAMFFVQLRIAPKTPKPQYKVLDY